LLIDLKLTKKIRARKLIIDNDAIN
jgi:hypothetical protein